MTSENQAAAQAVALDDAQIDSLMNKVKDEESFASSMFTILTSYTQTGLNLELLEVFYQHCSDEFPEFPSLFTDCINNYLLLFTGDEVQNKIKDLCIHAINSKYITPLQIAQGLPSEFLVKLNLISTKDQITRVTIPFITNNFKQKIYNLQREESEGYAMVLDLIISLPKYQEDLKSFSKKLMELTDAYSLNPLRILDIALLAIPQHIINHKELCINLIKLLPFYSPTLGTLHSQQFKELLGSLIGSKLKQSSTEEDSIDKKSEVRLAPEFYIMIAILIQEKLLDFHQVLSNMVPYTDSEGRRYDERYNRELIKKINWKPDNALLNLVALDDLARNFGLDNTPANNDNSDLSLKPTYTSTEKKQFEFGHPKENQIAKLLEALLFCGDIEHAEIIYLKFDKVFMYNEITISLLTRRILKMLEGKIQELTPIHSIVSNSTSTSDSQPEFSANPIYSDKNQKKLFPGVYDNLKQFPLDPLLLLKELKYWFNILNVYIGQDVTLMYELLKVYKDALLNTSHNQDVKDAYFNSFIQHILPAYSYSDSPSVLVPDVWDILKSLDQKKRFQLYDCWKDLLKRPVSPLQNKITKSIKSIKEVTRKASMKNAAESGNAYNRLIISCPFPCLDELIEHLLKFNGTVPKVSESFKRLNEMSLDLVTYMVLNFFEKDPKAQNFYSEDEINIAPWFQVFTKFIAMTHRRVLNWDLKPILLFIADKLIDGKIEFMYLLTSIINYLIGIEFSKTPTNNEIRAMAAGPKLKAFQLKSQPQTDVYLYTNRKSKDKWFLAFQSTPNLSSIISVTFLQRVQELLFSLDDIQKTNTIRERYDTFFTMFLLFIETFDDSNNPRKFHFDSLPKLDELITKFGVDPGVAFHIIRPNVATVIKSAGSATNGTQTENLLEKKFNETILPNLEPILGNIKDSCPSMFKEHLQLYIGFFSLTLRDIYFYEEDYTDSINILDAESRSIKASKHNSKDDLKKDKLRSEIIGPEIKLITLERNNEKKRYGESIERFKNLANTWFKAPSSISYSAYSLIAKSFFQHCLLPRIMVASSEALFCSQFIQRAHEVKIKEFPTCLIIDEVFNNLRPLLRSFTVLETSQFGIFLNEILNFVKVAHQSESFYNSNFTSPDYNGFADFNSKTLEKMPYNSFCNQVVKWHKNVHSVISESIKTGEDIYMNNVTTLRETIKENFPILLKETEEHISLIDAYLKSIGANDNNKFGIFGNTLKSILPNLVSVENFRKGIYKNVETKSTDNAEETQNKSNNDFDRSERFERNGRNDRGQKLERTSSNNENSMRDSDRDRGGRANRTQGMRSDRQNMPSSSLRSSLIPNVIRLTGDSPLPRHIDVSPQTNNLRDDRRENISSRNSPRRQRDDYDDQYSTNNMQNSFGGNHDRRRMRQSNNDQRQNFQGGNQSNINDNRSNNNRDNARDNNRDNRDNNRDNNRDSNRDNNRDNRDNRDRNRRNLSPVRRRDNRQRH